MGKQLDRRRLEALGVKGFLGGRRAFTAILETAMVARTKRPDEGTTRARSQAGVWEESFRE